MDCVEDIIVDILVTGGDEDAAVELQLVLLPPLLLHDLLPVLVLRLVLSPARRVVTPAVHVLHALPVLVVLGARQLRVTVLVVIVVLLVVIETLNLILILFLIGYVKQLEQSTLQLLLIILNNLHEHGIPDNPDALLLEHPLYLRLDVLILERLRINEGEISEHVLLLLLIVLPAQMTGLLGYHESYLLSSHPAGDEPLDAGVGAEGAPVDHAVLRPAPVRQRVHQGPAQAQVLVELRVVDREHALHVLLLLVF